MTYLTRIAVNPKSRESVRLLANPRRIHGELAKLSPEQNENSRLLWRLDSFPQSTWLYVLSPGEIDVRNLYQRIGHKEISPASLNFDEALEKISHGRSLRFCLRANVVKHAIDAGSANPRRPELTRGKPVGIITETGQQSWLKKQGERWGFEPFEDHLFIRPLPMERIIKRSHQGKYERTVSLNVVQFDGLLRVTDAERFRQALVKGIGKGKAYGLGMLTVSAVKKDE